MSNYTESQALSGEQQVRDVALFLMRMCGTIHDALRKSSAETPQDSATLPYALLTEEYALRSRANTLLIEAKRLARPGLSITQQEVLDVLETLYTRLEATNSLQELSELINSVMLFANSLMTKNGKVISFLLADLKDLINSTKSM